MKNALMIHNPRAGNGGSRRRRALDESRKVLHAAGIETTLAEVSAPGDTSGLARHAASEGRDLLIVCGGDGTLNEAVNGLAANPSGRQVPLALLPGGTANILAKELGLPWEFSRAAARLAGAVPRTIALGLATPLEEPQKRRYFLCVAGAGPDGAIVHAVDLELKGRAGILAYWYEGARQLFGYAFPKFRVRAAEHSLEASLLIAGRTKHFGGPFQITTEANLFEDRFECAALETQSAWRYLSYLPTLWLGRLRGAPGVHYWKADSIVCEPLGLEPVYAQVDGEPLARLPVEFRIVPGALTLLVPQPAQKARVA